MSAISATSLASSIPAGTVPTVDAALMPASIRNGDQKAKNAYQTGMAFEQVLVNELSQEMAATVPDGSDDGLGGTTDDSSGGGSSGGLMGGSSGLGAYSSLIPQALSSSIMTSGGTGVAMEIAKSIDPAIGQAKK
jgi:Rod binding domain-containing protein